MTGSSRRAAGRADLAYAAGRPVLRGGPGPARTGDAQPRADAVLADRAARALRQRHEHRRDDGRAQHARDHRLRRARAAPRRPGPDVRDRDRNRADVPVAADRVLARHLEPGGGAVPVPVADLPRLVAGVRRLPVAAADRARRELRHADAPDVRGCPPRCCSSSGSAACSCDGSPAARGPRGRGGRGPDSPARSGRARGGSGRGRSRRSSLRRCAGPRRRSIRSRTRRATLP